MAEPVSFLDATPEVFNNKIALVETNTIRPRHRDPIVGENGEFVFREVINREPTGRYLKVDGTTTRHCYAKDLTDAEITANGFPEDEADERFDAFCYAMREGVKAHLMTEGTPENSADDEAGKAMRIIMNWVRDEVEYEGHPRYQAMYTAMMKFGGYGYDTLEMDSPISVISFQNPQEISKEEAEAIIAANKAAGQGQTAGRAA